MRTPEEMRDLLKSYREQELVWIIGMALRIQRESYTAGQAAARVEGLREAALVAQSYGPEFFTVRDALQARADKIEKEGV